jgi:hypothetical protein
MNRIQQRNTTEVIMPKSRVSTTAKGGKVERLCRDFLIKHGYEVELSRLSKGAFDRVAIRCSRHPSGHSDASESRDKDLRGLLPDASEMLPDASDECVEEARYIQIKANSWRMDEASVQAMARTRLAEGCTREWWRHMDHPGRSCRIVPECWQARLVLPSGTFHAIPLLPEWKLAEGEDPTPQKPRPRRDRS